MNCSWPGGMLLKIEEILLRTREPTTVVRCNGFENAIAFFDKYGTVLDVGQFTTWTRRA